MEIDSITADALEVTTTGSYAGSQTLGEICHNLVDVFLWQIFPGGLQGDFQLLSCLGLRLGLWYFSSMMPQTC